MKTVNVYLGEAPNGNKTWGIAWKNNDNLFISREVEKSYLDKILINITTKEEYHYLVAEYCSKMFEELLNDNNVSHNIYEVEFICNGVCYKKTR